MPGRIIFQKVFQLLAPSMWAASTCSRETLCSPPRRNAMYQGSICQVRAMTTHKSAVLVWPSQGMPVSRMPSASRMLLRMPYCPLKIQLHKKPMAVPGIIQLTSVTPRRNSAPRKPWLSTMAQMRPRVKGRMVLPRTKASVVISVLPKYGSLKTFM